MRKVVLLEHVSLDGFVAGPHGEMDWIRFDEDLVDYVTPLTANADTAIYGRKTYEMMDSYWPTAADQPSASKHDIHHGHWYNAAMKLVVSRTLSPAGKEKTRIIADDMSDVIAEMKAQPGKDMLLIGSPSAAQEFIRRGLIDEYVITLNPVILGTGIALFPDKGPIDLKLAEAKTFPSGVIGLRYEKA